MQTNKGLTAQIKAMESKLRDAMLAGDTTALDSLLADDLIFTNQIGQRLTKADDMAVHESKRLRLTRIDIADQAVHAMGDCAIVVVNAVLAGNFDAQALPDSLPTPVFGNEPTASGKSVPRIVRRSRADCVITIYSGESGTICATAGIASVAAFATSARALRDFWSTTSV